MSDPTLTTLVGAFICWAFFFFVLQDEPIGLLLRKKIEEEVPEYEWYETAAPISSIWNSDKWIGMCGHCGMDDAPVYKFRNPDGKGARYKCKWCCELDNLNYHLAHHGTRRFKKVS